MHMQSVKISIPSKAYTKIGKIVKEEELFEDSHDFILHAITDLLENYKKRV